MGGVDLYDELRALLSVHPPGGCEDCQQKILELVEEIAAQAVDEYRGVAQ